MSGGHVPGERAPCRDVDRAVGQIVRRADGIASDAVLIDAVTANLGRAFGRRGLAGRAGAGLVAPGNARGAARAFADRARAAQRKAFVRMVVAVVVDAVAQLVGLYASVGRRSIAGRRIARRRVARGRVARRRVSAAASFVAASAVMPPASPLSPAPPSRAVLSTRPRSRPRRASALAFAICHPPRLRRRRRAWGPSRRSPRRHRKRTHQSEMSQRKPGLHDSPKSLRPKTKSYARALSVRSRPTGEALDHRSCSS